MFTSLRNWGTVGTRFVLRSVDVTIGLGMRTERFSEKKSKQNFKGMQKLQNVKH
jgi:hypothetical protein